MFSNINKTLKIKYWQHKAYFCFPALKSLISFKKLFLFLKKREGGLDDEDKMNVLKRIYTEILREIYFREEYMENIKILHGNFKGNLFSSRIYGKHQNWDFENNWKIKKFLRKSIYKYSKRLDNGEEEEELSKSHYFFQLSSFVFIGL